MTDQTIISEKKLVNPFPGLRSFEPHEEHLFFGREAQIDELLKRLRRTRFLSVIGSSGSGKSSLVRCGLIPALYSGYMVRAGSYWKIAIFRPGDDPLGNLAESLIRPTALGLDGGDDLFGDEESEPTPNTDEVTGDLDRALIYATLNRGSRGLVEAVSQTGLAKEENLLIVVDQFEELFRFKRESKKTGTGDQASAFIKLLLEATAQNDLPIYVVLTMRSDFLENCTEFQGLTEAINEGQYLVPRLTREQRRAAVTGPVAVGGVEIAPRLVSRLLNDVGDNPDQLPILQHALMRTWEFWARERTGDEPLDLRHYEAIGTMREALSLHAEEAFQELRTDQNKHWARKVFEALTEKGLDGRGVRRPTKIQDICAVTGVSEDHVLLIVERFRQTGRSFLVPPVGFSLTSETTLDISHESLMRVWTRLRKWVDEEARSAKLYLKLARDADRFQRGASGLLRDPELEMTLRWREEQKPTAAWAERYDPSYERAMLFLEKSKQERDRGIARREAVQRQRLRRSRIIALFFFMLTVLLLIFGVYGYLQRIKAEEQAYFAAEQAQVADQAKKEALDSLKNEKKAREEAEGAQAALKEQADNLRRAEEEARNNYIKATQEKDKAKKAEEEAIRAKDEALQLKRAADDAKAEMEEQKSIAEKKTVQAEENFRRATESEEQAKKLLLSRLATELSSRASRETDQDLAALAALLAYKVSGLSGRLINTDLDRGLRQSIKKLNGSLDRKIVGFPDSVRAMAVSRQKNILLVGDNSGVIHLIDLDQEVVEPKPIQSVESGIRSLCLSPDESLLAAGEMSGVVHVWQRTGHDFGNAPSQYKSFSDRGAVVYALAFSPDGAFLASAGADGVVMLRSTADFDSPPRLLGSFSGAVRALAFGPESRSLLIGGDGGAFWIENFEGPGKPDTVTLKEERVYSVAVDPKGVFLAVGTREGVIRLWRRSRPTWEPDNYPGHQSSVNGLVFDQEGGLLASVSSDQSVKLWLVGYPGKSPVVLADHESWVWTLGFGRGFEKLYSAGADKSVREWTLSLEDLADLLCGLGVRELRRDDLHKLIEDIEIREVILNDFEEYRNLCPKN